MRTGIKADGEKDVVIHSRRHTWASRLTQAGMHPIQLKEIGGVVEPEARRAVLAP